MEYASHHAVLAESERTDPGLARRVRSILGEVVLVQTHKGLLGLLHHVSVPEVPDVLALDCEGEALHRHGAVDTLQLKAWSDGPTYVVEVQAVEADLLRLKADTSTSASIWTYSHPRSGVSLSSLLKDPEVRLLYVDCRKDADALYHVHGIRQRNVYDLQVADAAARFLETGKEPTSMRPAHRILSRVTTHAQHEVLVQLQRLGHDVHTCAGGTSVWRDTPLHELMVLYAASDVSMLHALYRSLRGEVRRRDTGTFYASWVARASASRLKLAHTGSAATTREDMWAHPALIQMVNPCMAAQVPPLPSLSKTQARRRTTWNTGDTPTLALASTAGAGAGAGASAGAGAGAGTGAGGGAGATAAVVPTTTAATTTTTKTRRNRRGRHALALKTTCTSKMLPGFHLAPAGSFEAQALLYVQSIHARGPAHGHARPYLPAAAAQYGHSLHPHPPTIGLGYPPYPVHAPKAP